MHNPHVPETLEGWSVLHLMYRVAWDRLATVSAADRDKLADDAVVALAPAGPGGTALVQVLGHKADVMVILFRSSFDELAEAELAFSRSPLHAYLERAASYVSIVELGLYELTGKIHAQLGHRLKPGSEEYEQAFDEQMAPQRDRVASRLFMEIPHARYVCFYPMNKRRGEAVNWYAEPFDRRALLMREHGAIGRQYAGQVTQVISGSIGYDDWEWGVDLFAADPVVFKKLIYEMRFDEASAKYGEFGPFYTGLQFAPAHLRDYLAGHVPSLV